MVRAGPVGQNLSQQVDERCTAFLTPAGLLGTHEVHPSLEQATHVRQVRLLLLGVMTQGTHLVERSLTQPVEEVLGEHAVDTASAVGHRLGHAATPVRSLVRSSS